MRRIIDAHVHIIPKGRAGTRNEQMGVAYEKYGKLTLFNGFTVQGLPEYLENSEYTADTIINQMDCFGVEKAVIMAAAATNVEESVAAVAKYPNRFLAAMTIRQEEDCFEKMERYLAKGLTAMKFETSEVLGYTHPTMYPDFKFDSPLMERVYDKCAELGITVVIDPGPQGSKGYQTAALDAMAQKHSGTHYVICHLGVPGPGIEENEARNRAWQDMMALARHPNVWFDICAMVAFYTDEEYPYTTPVRYVRDFMDKYGAEKAIWGSDIPSTLVHATYRQMINMYERSGLFTEAEKDKMFFFNAVKAYRIYL